MNNDLCKRFGIDFPLFAFSHCRDVVVEVSKAGGMGVLGVVRFSPEELETELKWIDDHIDGKPYGVDLIVPNKMDGRDEDPAADEILSRIPEEHKAFTDELMRKFNVDPSDVGDDARRETMYLSENARVAGAERAMDVAFSHPIAMIANALGVPPQSMLDKAKEHGVPVAALVGTKEHAVAQVNAGVDLIIAAGTEAGGHCGEIGTMVLVPDVVEAVEKISDVPVLAAGGIVQGRQMAAAMSMGASGAWCGSVWLTTTEAENSPAIKEKLLAAGTRDTVRSRARTGKYSRQLRSAWTDAWESADAPEKLPLPLQNVLVTAPLRKVEKLATGGHEGAKELNTYFVGQGVGMMNEVQSARQTVQAFRDDFLAAYERLHNALEGDDA
ncbi:nitronate monooxygenase [uncultured Sulfitobacter sp.]|uniref:nitronate monooxygenase n=1 Tax=uncultured Sulfitobacter sp. TaxID=191468 RepID=UPI00261319C9|nr:nitronate monooxygenase [uncultured Sulfitobacter sp.]